LGDRFFSIQSGVRVNRDHTVTIAKDPTYNLPVLDVEDHYFAIKYHWTVPQSEALTAAARRMHLVMIARDAELEAEAYEQ